MSCSESTMRAIPGQYLPVSVQLAMRASDHPAAHVLDYLAKCEHAAALRSRRDLVEHYQQCWRFLHELCFGLLPLPILRQLPIPACPPPEPSPLKPWEKQKYSRPVRKVVARREVEVRDGNRAVIGHQTVLELECGHEFTHGFVLDTTDKPLRRRCRDCAQAIHAAAVEMRRLKGRAQ